MPVSSSPLLRPPGSYPFPTILESDIPADYSKWLYFHKQFPTDLPRFKSKVTVDIRDLGLDPHSRMALREIVGPRYNRRTHTVSFVSRTLATAQANENRVFQMLDLALIEARTLGKQMQEDGIPASQSGAENNRLLKAVPSEASVKQQQLAARRVKLNELRVAAGKKPIAVRSSAATDEQAGDAAAAVDEAARTPKMTRALRAALDIGLTREEKEVICDIAGRTAAQEQQQQQ